MQTTTGAGCFKYTCTAFNSGRWDALKNVYSVDIDTVKMEPGLATASVIIKQLPSFIGM